MSRLAADAVWPAGVPGLEARRVTLPGGEAVRVVRCRPTTPEPDAPVVVCVHGWGCSAYSWRFVLPALAAAGIDAIAPDVRGHGWSDKPLIQALYSPEALGRWLLTLLDALGVRRAVLVGHSMGGAIVLHAALDAPGRVAGLALLAPVGFGEIPRAHLLRALTPGLIDPLLQLCATRTVVGLALRTGYGAIGRPTDRDVDEYWAATADPAFVRATRLVAHAFGWRATAPEDLARVACPVHLLLGERDELVPNGITQPHVRHLRRAHVDVVPRAGHVLAEEVPEVVNAALLADVRGWWSAASVPRARAAG